MAIRQVALQHRLRDVRLSADGDRLNVLYHVAIYTGRTDVPRDGFRPQASEVDELGYFPPEEVDQMLLEGALSPNMAFLWLTRAHDLLRRAR